MSRSRHADMSDADTRVLSYLDDSGADYPALIASNTGLHIPFVERRCEALHEQGLLERVSNEMVYRITERGGACLRSTPESPHESARE